MADVIIVQQGEQRVSVDLTKGWDSSQVNDRTEAQQAVTEGNAKYIPDKRKAGVQMCSEIVPGTARRDGHPCSHGYYQPHFVYPEQPKPVEPVAAAPVVKRGRGRPKGSKNKPKAPAPTEVK